MKLTNITLVQTTLKDKTEVNELARSSVELGLCACVKIAKVKSVYRWNGALEEDKEYDITFKTNKESAGKLVDHIKTSSSYDLPQIIVSEAQSTEEYAAWVGESCSPIQKLEKKSKDKVAAIKL